MNDVMLFLYDTHLVFGIGIAGLIVFYIAASILLGVVYLLNDLIKGKKK